MLAGAGGLAGACGMVTRVEHEAEWEVHIRGKPPGSVTESWCAAPLTFTIPSAAVGSPKISDCGV